MTENSDSSPTRGEVGRGEYRLNMTDAEHVLWNSFPPPQPSPAGGGSRTLGVFQALRNCRRLKIPPAPLFKRGGVRFF